LRRCTAAPLLLEPLAHDAHRLSPKAIQIYRDGAPVWTRSDRAAIPDVAHHLDIQLDPRAMRTLTTPVRCT
jgi:hypothetical protein